MSIRTVTCYTITCDICASEYDTNGAQECPLHFESPQLAIAAATTDSEWTVDPDGRHICEACVHERNRARCVFEGHIWAAWHPCGCRGYLPQHALFGCDLLRYCLRPGCDAEQSSTLAALPTTEEPPGR